MALILERRFEYHLRSKTEDTLQKFWSVRSKNTTLPSALTNLVLNLPSVYVKIIFQCKGEYVKSKCILSTEGLCTTIRPFSDQMHFYSTCF